jgi:hypothetical protein
MRKITFTNSNNVSIVFSDDTDYKITKLNGLSTPSLQNQEQKAPFQDGTTYIDTLIDVREITMEGAINKPKNLSAINSAKDTMLRVLNPKLGEGTLLYEASGSVSKKIQCTPKIIFSNKDAREPFQMFQVTFRCCDPYFKDVNQSTTTLASTGLGVEESVNNAASSDVSICYKSNSDIVIVYRRNSDNYLCMRTRDNVTDLWSSESVINSAASYTPCIIQKSNGNLLVVYRIASIDIVSREYSGSWGAQSSAIAAGYDPSIIQLASGDIFLSYAKTPSLYLAYRTYTTSWSSETVFLSSAINTPRAYQNTDGTIDFTYVLSSSIKYYISKTD